MYENKETLLIKDNGKKLNNKQDGITENGS